MKTVLENVIEHYHCAHGIPLAKTCGACQHEVGGEERVLPRRGVERHTLDCGCFECTRAADSFTSLAIRRALGAITYGPPEKWAAWVLYLLQGLESLAHAEVFAQVMDDLLAVMADRLRDGAWPIEGKGGEENTMQ